ncbi:ABC transporter ATP-binding protein [Thermococcus thioreducens]|uniref:ABC-2 type transport system ATP-binding protein/Cu-processing system ATP-binding protein n=1 Tax=Thermococcus thioreducens TaxID=277988 RepID=A0A0Q2XNU1_9EURY|nr:ATP-binding cassette domain-containing protein [Thermococcus thioreducens]ASJ12199.1 hypothetical protein A3L14_04550 [Thermococcus thioreducens]KQH82940.1 hypothetical protein AMR53_01545 [Thermococcus thioreducens]SEV95027.1 ABC-2 type transport system ATP-binding protein/Cu-processing system ATP-binding protein [Thermococcus thioreducens]
MGERILSLRNLTCGYRVPLLSASFELKTGEHLVIYGPNGTGKTTLLRTIVGLLRPISGEVEILGKRAKRGSPIMKNVFYLPETIDLPAHLRAREYVELIFDLYGEKPDLARIHEGLNVLELGPFYQRRIGNLSQGQRRKLQLLVAYTLKRKLTVLDDPTIGIDKSGSNIVRYIVNVLTESGAVLITSRNPIVGLNNISIEELKKNVE